MNKTCLLVVCGHMSVASTQTFHVFDCMRILRVCKLHVNITCILVLCRFYVFVDCILLLRARWLYNNITCLILNNLNLDLYLPKSEGITRKGCAKINCRRHNNAGWILFAFFGQRHHSFPAKWFTNIIHVFCPFFLNQFRKVLVEITMVNRKVMTRQ